MTYQNFWGHVVKVEGGDEAREETPLRTALCQYLKSFLDRLRGEGFGGIGYFWTKDVHVSRMVPRESSDARS